MTTQLNVKKSIRAAKMTLALLVAIYSIAFIDQLINKGWRNEEARLLANKISTYASERKLPARVNLAQEYADGCSFWLLEIYWRPCFSIHLALLPNARINDVKNWGLEQLIMKEFNLVRSREGVILNGLDAGAKVNLKVAQHEEIEGPNGARRNELLDELNLTLRIN